MKKLPYYMVVEKAVQPDGTVKLFPQFGDTSKAVAAQERLDLARCGFSLVDLTVVTLEYDEGTDPAFINVDVELAKIAANLGAK